MHAARSKVQVVVLGRARASALVTAEVENYFGVEFATGESLVGMGRRQAQGFGATLLEEDVVSIGGAYGSFTVTTDHGTDVSAKTMILAPGISRKRLGAKGEKEFLGKGVSYCAQCDCNFYRGRTVALVGDESEAVSSSLLMTEYANKVYWIVADPDISPQLMERIESSPVELVSGVKVVAIDGDKFVESLELDDGRKLAVDGVFIELGARSSVELAFDVGILPTPEGFIIVDGGCATEVEGVFAAGDVTGKPWQLARAVGQGCVAGTNAAKLARKV